MKIIMVPNGQTSYDVNNYYTGWHNPGLTENGRKEAKDVAKILRQYRYLSTSRIFCSNLNRAKETMRIIKNQNMLYGLWREIVPIIDSRLNEINYGTWAGKTKEEIIDSIGKEEYEYMIDNWKIKYQFGESIQDVYDRVESFLNFLKKEGYEKNHTILIISHIFTIKVAMNIMGYITKESINNYSFPNTSIIETIWE